MGARAIRRRGASVWAAERTGLMGHMGPMGFGSHKSHESHRSNPLLCQRAATSAQRSRSKLLAGRPLTWNILEVLSENVAQP
jgi:hypothetical protein